MPPESPMNVKLLTAWQQVLGACKVKQGEMLVFLVAEHSHPEHVEAGRAAASLLGARLMSLQLGETTMRAAGETTAYIGPTSLTGNKAAVAAMKSADMVVDLMGIDRGTEQQEILDSGTRILLVKEPPEIFMRLMPTQEEKRRTLAAAAILKKARSMHVTSKTGTDFKVEFGQYGMLVQYGLADEPGRWDHCPSTFVATWPTERTSNGIVVLDPGTTLLPIKEYVR